MTTTYPFSCLLLSGMPGTGKDTLSRLLVEREPAFAFFRKHRATSLIRSNGANDMYIPVSLEEFQAIADRHGFIQFHGRYGKRYGVSKDEYQRLIGASRIPIIHVGKYENVQALRRGGLETGLSLLLWADRAVVQSRLEERHQHRTDGVEERLVAYDQEIAQLRDAFAQGELDFDLIFVNNGSDPFAAAGTLLSSLRSQSAGSKKMANAILVQLLESASHTQRVE